MLAVSAREETAPCEVITDSGATNMHALSLHLSAMQGWRVAGLGRGPLPVYATPYVGLC